MASAFGGYYSTPGIKATGFGTGTSYNAPTQNNALTDAYKLYNTAVQQQAGDYGSIMEGYRNLLNQGPNAEYSKATANLGDLAQTGGLSAEDIANLRARGISPIRSIYSSAARNVERQKALQGGYSPGYGALQSRLAREMSEQLAGRSTDVEAAIAEMRQKGRLTAAPQYAAAAERTSQIPLQALSGMSSLYGTTPALASLYGNQALQGAQFQNQINQQGQQYGMNMINRVLGSL